MSRLPHWLTAFVIVALTAVLIIVVLADAFGPKDYDGTTLAVLIATTLGGAVALDRNQKKGE